MTFATPAARSPIAFLAALVLAVPADAQTTREDTSARTQAAARPMTFDDVMAMRSLGAPEISPDGRSIVYTVSQWDHTGAGTTDVPARHSHLWLVNTAGGTPRQLTVGEHGESGPKWSPDGKTIAFAATRATGDADPRPQVWLLPLNGGEARQLTHARDGVGGFAWSPDGHRIAFLSADSLPHADEARRRQHDDAQAFESTGRLTHPWIVDVASGQASEVAHGAFTLAALGISSVPQWSPDGTRIAFVVSPTGLLRDLRGDVYVLTLATGRLDRIAPEYRSAPVVLSQPAWSPNGETLAFPSFPQSTVVQGDSIPEPLLGNGELVLYDVRSGQAHHLPHPALDVTLGSMKWTPDGRSLLFSAADRTYESVFRYDVAPNRIVRLTHDVVVHGFSVSRDGAGVALAMETSASPADVYRTDLTFTSPHRLTTVNPQIAHFALGRAEVITWKSSDGTSIEGILLQPVGYEPGRRYPLLVEEHGGPTGASLDDFKASSGSPGQVWAGRGWAVLYPNPRGSEGYGTKFMTANIKDLGGGDYRDIMAGVDDLIRRGVADSARMAFEGWSYGGYMTAWVVGHTSRFKAARMGAGMSDLLSMYGTSEIGGYIGLFEGGMPSAATYATYREQSPITYADRVTTPLLILHGAVDPRVPPGQSMELFRALRDRGKIVELVLYPREPHGMTEYYHLLDRMQRDYAWISKYTPRAPTTGATR